MTEQDQAIVFFLVVMGFTTWITITGKLPNPQPQSQPIFYEVPANASNSQP